MTAILGGIVRAVLAYAGGTQAVSDNDVEQVIGALALLASIAWSVYQKVNVRDAD